jgi:hypothetical protein
LEEEVDGGEGYRVVEAFSNEDLAVCRGKDQLKWGNEERWKKASN